MRGPMTGGFSTATRDGLNLQESRVSPGWGSSIFPRVGDRLREGFKGDRDRTLFPSRQACLRHDQNLTTDLLSIQ